MVWVYSQATLPQGFFLVGSGSCWPRSRPGLDRKGKKATGAVRFSKYKIKSKDVTLMEFSLGAWLLDPSVTCTAKDRGFGISRAKHARAAKDGIMRKRERKKGWADRRLFRFPNGTSKVKI